MSEAWPLLIAFIFGKAVAVFPWVAHRSSVYATGHAAADIADKQLQGAADCCVSAATLTQSIDPRVNTHASGDSTVNDNHGCRKIGRAQQAVHAEFVFQRSLNRSEHHRKILGLAACEYRINGHFLDGARSVVWGHAADEFVGAAMGAAQHAHHS